MGEAKKCVKYRHLMLPGTFPGAVTSDIDFTDEAMVQCDASVAVFCF